MNTDPAAPAQTKAVIPIAKGYTIAAGHRLGIAIGVLHSQNTVADQLFYDSDTYPSGLTIVPGSIQNISVCGVPGVPVAVGSAGHTGRGQPDHAARSRQWAAPGGGSGRPPCPAFGWNW